MSYEPNPLQHLFLYSPQSKHSFYILNGIKKSEGAEHLGSRENHKILILVSINTVVLEPRHPIHFCAVTAYTLQQQN